MFPHSPPFFLDPAGCKRPAIRVGPLSDGPTPHHIWAPSIDGAVIEATTAPTMKNSTIATMMTTAV